jgi:hypothetical protein
MTSRADRAIACALAATTLAVCLYFSPRGFRLGFVDMGHDGYQLQQAVDLSRGGVIFRDTFDQYGPLNGYLNVIGFLTLGRNLLAMKYFVSICYALTAIVLFMIARVWLDAWLAGFTVVLWIALAPFYGHGIMISPHAYALLFQAVATLILLRAPDLNPRRYAIVGTLAALCWAVKQSMGVLYMFAVLVFLALHLFEKRPERRSVLNASVALAAPFFGIVAGMLAWLWSQGALHDYYLQTISFPREFYLANAQSARAADQPDILRRAIDGLVAFAQLQRTESPLWIIIRATVFGGALISIARGRLTSGIVLIAAITAFLWPAAYPSANFMHQWWTVSLALASFVVCARRVAGTIVESRRTVAIATVACVLILSSFDIVHRAVQARVRAVGLDHTLSQPPLLRGIKTDRSTARVFDTFVRVMTQYRAAHPGTRIVSIDAADGWNLGMVETLPFLAVFNDNRHSQPIYWSLPVLSTSVYPRYGEQLWKEVREERPLIVDHRGGKYRPAHIAGYQVLAAAEGDSGHWYVLAPDGDDVRKLATYLASDGAIERGFPEEVIPALATRLSLDRFGAWRGQIVPPFEETYARLQGDYPLELVGAARRPRASPVNVYTWPRNLEEATVGPSLEPVRAKLEWRGGKYDIVRDFEPSAWSVEGLAQLPSAYLLQWAEEPVDRGATFVARGEVSEGGVEIGFLSDGQWVGSVCVSRPGPFEAVLQIQEPARYGLVVANCITADWWTRSKGSPAEGVLSLFRRGHLRNRFSVSQAGWVTPQPALARRISPPPRAVGSMVARGPADE